LKPKTMMLKAKRVSVAATAAAVAATQASTGTDVSSPAPTAGDSSSSAPSSAPSTASVPAPPRYLSFRVSPGDTSMRFDRWIALHFPLARLSFSRLEALCRARVVRRVGKGLHASSKLSAGDEVSLPTRFVVEPSVPTPTKHARCKMTSAQRAKFLASVLHEDEDFAVINKPTGLAVFRQCGMVHTVKREHRVRTRHEIVRNACDAHAPFSLVIFCVVFS
jgi:hypothetical protein